MRIFMRDGMMNLKLATLECQSLYDFHSIGFILLTQERHVALRVIALDELHFVSFYVLTNKVLFHFAEANLFRHILYFNFVYLGREL